MNIEITQIEKEIRALKYDYERLQFLYHKLAYFDELYNQYNKFEKVLLAELELRYRTECKTVQEAMWQSHKDEKYKKHLDDQNTARRNMLDIKALIKGLECKLETEKMEQMSTMAEMKYTKNHN